MKKNKAARQVQKVFWDRLLADPRSARVHPEVIKGVFAPGAADWLESAKAKGLCGFQGRGIVLLSSQGVNDGF